MSKMSRLEKLNDSAEELIAKYFDLAKDTNMDSKYQNYRFVKPVEFPNMEQKKKVVSVIVVTTNDNQEGEELRRKINELVNK